MPVFADIQQRFKEGQDRIAPVINSALANPTVESLVNSGKSLLDKPEVRKVISQGQDVRAEVETRLRTVESQGRELLQANIGKVVEGSRRVENEVIEAANRALTEGQKLAEDKAPFLVSYIERARGAVKVADGQFNKLQATAKATAGALPIEGYDALNAKAAASAVKKLSDADLLVVQSYEAANKNRRTVLSEIDALLKAQ